VKPLKREFGVELPAGSRGRAPGQEIKGRSRPEAETLGFRTFNGSRKFAHFSKIWNAKKSNTICVVFANKKLELMLRRRVKSL